MWWRGQKAKLQAEYQALPDDVALDPEIKEKLIAKYMLDVPILTVCQIIPDLFAELGKRHRVNRQTHLFRVAVTREMPSGHNSDVQWSSPPSTENVSVVHSASMDARAVQSFS